MQTSGQNLIRSHLSESPANGDEGRGGRRLRQKKQKVDETKKDAELFSGKGEQCLVEPSVSGRRGRGRKKSARVDVKAKLEKSRQSARECRARKKLRYQYLEDLVNKREQAVVSLRKELDMVSFNTNPIHLNTPSNSRHTSPSQYKNWCLSVDNGADPRQALESLTVTNKIV